MVFVAGKISGHLFMWNDQPFFDKILIKTALCKMIEMFFKKNIDLPVDNPIFFKNKAGRIPVGR